MAASLTTSCICIGGSLKPPRTRASLAKLKRARVIACHLVGADPTTAPVCHPLRWPGSWHRKAAPRPCEIITEASDLDHEIDLDEALRSSSRWRRLPAPADANGAAGPSADWDEHVGNILRGEQLHKSITELAMKLVVSGMGGRAAGNHLRALMRQSQAPRDERWQNRFDYIPRAVGSARKKLADQAAEQRGSQRPRRKLRRRKPGVSTSGNGAAQRRGLEALAPEQRRRRRAGYAGRRCAAGPHAAARSVRHSRRSSRSSRANCRASVDEAEAALLADIARQQLYQRGELVVRPVRLKLRAADMQGTSARLPAGS